jgi:hypothetical protein
MHACNCSTGVGSCCREVCTAPACGSTSGHHWYLSAFCAVPIVFVDAALEPFLHSQTAMHVIGQDPAPSLVELPGPVLAELVRTTQPEGRKSPRLHPSLRRPPEGHPLLRVARAGRDAVLQHSKALILRLQPADSPAAVEPVARLLDRAWSQAAEGLRVRLTCVHNVLWKDVEEQVPLVLKPGVER